ncbi:MAG: hypothetical protein ACKKL6_01810 [Candidatus Komeilibacteria bacterium]
MNNIIKHIRRYLVSFIALIVNILLWLWLVIYIQPSTDSLVLHYNIYFGIDQLGSGLKLYLMPLFGLIILAINLLLVLSGQADKKLANYSSWISLIVQVLLIVSLLLLVINYF